MKVAKTFSVDANEARMLRRILGEGSMGSDAKLAEGLFPGNEQLQDEMVGFIEALYRELGDEDGD